MRNGRWYCGLVVSLFLMCSAIGQNAAQSLDADTYSVYALVIQNAEEAVIGRTKTQPLLIIQQTTNSMQFGKSNCQGDWSHVIGPWNDAASDYIARNQKVWTLEPKIPISQDYKLIPREQFNQIFAELHKPTTAESGNFRTRTRKIQEAYERLEKLMPGSTGYIELSAVGFDADHARGLVYMVASCGWLCSKADLWHLEKIEGKWTISRARGLPFCSSIS